MCYCHGTSGAWKAMRSHSPEPSINMIKRAITIYIFRGTIKINEWGITKIIILFFI